MVCSEDPTEAIYNIILEYLSRHKLDEVGLFPFSPAASIAHTDFLAC